MKKMNLGLLFSRVRYEEKLLLQAAQRHAAVQLVPLSSLLIFSVVAGADTMCL